MNFIMASIMFHCNEEVAFWVFVQLIQLNVDVRSVYEPPNMPGLQFHVQILEQIIKQELPNLDFYLTEDLGLSTHQIYLHDWVICLFTSIMPIGRNFDFLIEFIDQGWIYFYAVCIAILKCLEPWILEQT